MERIINAVAFISFLLAFQAEPATIDFETQAVHAPSGFDGRINSPLTIGIATFVGGELLRNEANGSDSSAVYATTNQGGFTAYTNPLVITFSQPVSNVSLLLTNEFPDTYTLSGNNAISATSAVNGNTNQTLILSDKGLTSLTLSATTPYWDYAIDNVGFTALANVPEPATDVPIAACLVMIAFFSLWGRCKPAADCKIGPLGSSKVILTRLPESGDESCVSESLVRDISAVTVHSV